MKNKMGLTLNALSEIEFGAVVLSDGAKKFCWEWNNEIIALCKSLPESTQTDALLFFMKNSGLSFEDDLNFFRTYYIPTWSIIYWLLQNGTDDAKLKQADVINAKKAHSMAMFLHALDDHLKDSQMPVTHLSLLLRSQAWMIMHTGLKKLANEIDGGNRVVRDLINDYYSSIRNRQKIETLEAYCELFRKQMATGMIAPVLMIKKMGKDEKSAAALKRAYGSFGIAWRLLDDLKDIEADMSGGIHSAIYTCLSEETKNLWIENRAEKPGLKSRNNEIILNDILENRVVDKIKDKIFAELTAAASIADTLDMTGWADEFRCLLKPLKNKQQLL
jgi:hypothetical protein